MNIFSKVANNEKLADALVYVGIFGSAIFSSIAMCAAYLRGMRKGVDVRDDYYYEKEINDGRE